MRPLRVRNILADANEGLTWTFPAKASWSRTYLNYSNWRSIRNCVMHSSFGEKVPRTHTHIMYN
jgi:hypothetical protein